MTIVTPQAAVSYTDSRQHSVRGKVLLARGGPLERVVVRVFGKNLVEEWPLGEPAHTNEDGVYVVHYERSRDRVPPAVVVRAIRDDSVIGQSAVVYRPPADATIDVVVGGGAYLGPSEFERLLHDVRRVCEERPIESLTPDEVTTVASMTGWATASVQALVDSFKASRGQQVPADVFYALWSERVDTSAGAVTPATPAIYEQALLAAVGANVVPPIVEERLDAIVAALVALAVKTQSAPSATPGSPTVADYLGAAGVAPEVQTAFASAYLQSDASPADFWAAHANDPRIGGANATAIQQSLQLAVISLGHPPLVAALRSQSNGVPPPATLASYTAADWRKVIDSNVGSQPVGAPVTITGATEDDRRNTYAQALVQVVSDAYPAGRVAAELQRAGAMPQVVQYLAANPALDVRTMRPPSSTIQDSAASSAPALRDQLLSVQRVTRVVPDLGHASALLASGATSGQAVARMSLGDLQGVLGQDVAEGTLRDIQIRARNSTQLGMAVDSNLHAKFRGTINPYIGDPVQTALDSVPSLRQLFGSITACACEECQAADGPAAYMVDLLHFISNYSSTALSTLLTRRPELANVELSCANTLTAMPMIDLVNEALEAAAKGSTAANQTTWQTPELLANPEHLDPTAYTGLSTALYPWALPFEMPLEEARVYMTHLGLDRVALMEALRAVKPTDVDVPQEILRMPAAEWTELSTSAATVAADRWGAGATAAALGNVGELLRRSGLATTDLPDLLASPFVNPASPNPLVLNTNDTCDPDLSTIAHQDGSAFDDASADRVLRFVRLRRRLGWTMPESDRGVHVLGADQINQDLLFCLSSFERVRKELGLSVGELTAFWALLDTRSVDGGLSQYESLFLDRTVQFIDPSTDPFRLATGLPPGAPPEIAGAGGPAQLQANLPRILSALTLTRTDVDAVVDVTTTPFNLATLSLLFRTAKLASALGISVPDLKRYRSLLPIDPYDPSIPLRDRIERLRTLVDSIRALKKGPLSLDELGYVLLHDTSNPTVARSDARAVLAGQLTSGLKTIAADAAAAATNPNATDVVKRRLPILLSDPNDLTNALAILDDVPGAPLASAATYFAFAPAAVPTLSADIPPPPAGVDPNQYRLDQIAARYALVRQPLIDRTTQMLREALVQKKIGDTFAVGVEVAKAILSSPFLAPGTVLTPLQVLSSGTPASAQADTITRLHKIALLSSRLSLAASELAWFASPPSGFSLNTIPVAAVATSDARPLLSLYDFVRLRNEQPDGQPSLVGILQEAKAPPATLFTDFAAAMGWDATEVTAVTTLLAINPTDLTDVGPMVRVETVHGMLARVGLPLDRVQPWAGTVDAATSAQVRDAAKSKHTQAEWLTIARALRDPLRQKQRDALVAYLVGNGYTRAGQTYTFQDEDALAQHFLFDLEAGTCQITSRIKQALGCIQVFIQRCLMNLEGDALNLGRTAAKQWQWMRAYRVWQANRQIFLYPFDWLDPSLRDDKTPLFADFEAALSTGALTDDVAQKALRGYAEGLDAIAKLDVVGMFRELDAQPPPAQPDPDLLDPTTTIHVLARSDQAPHTWYVRRRDNGYAWTPWVKVDRDIPTDDVTLMIFNRHPWLLWLEGRTSQGDPPTTTTAPQPGQSTPISQPPRNYDVYLSWSEYLNGRWLPTKTSKKYWRTELPDGMDPRSPDFGPMTLHTSVHGLFDANDTPPQLRVTATHCWDTAGGTTDIADFILRGCNAQPDVYASLWGYPTPVVLPRFTSIDHSGFAGYPPLSLPISTSSPATLAILSTLDYFFTPQNHNDVSVLGSGPSEFTLRYASNDAQIFFPPFTYADQSRIFVIDRAPRPRIIIQEPLLPSSIPTLVARYVAPPPAPPPTPQLELVTRATNGVAASAALSPNITGLVAAADPQSTADSTASRVPPTYFPPLRFRFFNFFHPYACEFVLRLEQYGVDGLLRWDMPDNAPDPLQLRSADRFATDYAPNPSWVVTPYPKDDVDFDLCGAYSQYNWELFFHAPLLIATRFTQDQQFELAMKWFHYMFDPTTQPTASDPAPSCYWKVLPFKQQQQIPNITDLLTALASGQDPALSSSCHTETLTQRIADWANDPFNPWLVARERPGSYQWAVVLKYLDNLIAWGDQLFRQDTIESITQATQLYILASQILGPRPDPVPTPQSTAAWTWQQLVAGGHLDSFSNELETYLPPPATTANNAGYPFHQSPSLVFCIPANANLLTYWDTVDDRLYKIRHCMNIQGVVQQLPLFEPPLNPGALVAGFADAADLSTALSDTGAAVPRYRFSVMVQKTNELCAELRGLGSALLAALEKKDAEEMSRIHAKQEKELLTAIRAIKQSALDEANHTLEGLQSYRDAVQTRNTWFASRDLVSPEEGIALAMQTLSQILQLVAQGVQAGASTAAYFPEAWFGTAGAFGSPVMLIAEGGENVSNGLGDTAQAIGVAASALNTYASLISTLAAYQRRKDEWDMQAQATSSELDQANKQIDAQNVRIQMAQTDLDNQDLQIDHADQINAFLQDKYTSEELYEWMAGQVSTVYFQTYQLAYDMAKRAEAAFQYELGLDPASSSTFIQFGYWDNRKQGLLAGERLQADLRRMEATYLDLNQRELEITKHLSLALLFPDKLLELRRTGTTTFTLDEWLYDLDLPGHYMRRIRNVSLTIPCVAGPYQSVHATLTMLEDQRRMRPDVGGTLTKTTGATQAIVTSSAQNDAGLFDPSFRDERYLPFEGAGAISTWKLSLGDRALRAFDWDTITDVVVHVRYTARDGGKDLHDDAVNRLNAMGAESQGQRFVSCRGEAADAWYAFFKGVQQSPATLDVTLPLSSFPFAAQGKTVTVTSVLLFPIWTDAAGAPPPVLPIQLTKGGTPAPADHASPVSLEYDNVNVGVDPKTGIELTFTLAEASIPAAVEVDVTEGGVTRRRLRPDMLRDVYLLLKYSTT